MERIAAWAHELRHRDVPPAVLGACRAQRRSVIGASAASLASAPPGAAAAWRVVRAVDGWAGPGPAPLLGTDRLVEVEHAVYAATALSVALDFDDYVCFGHTGHSAVHVPALVATETGSSGQEQLLAQVVANEVEARLGAALLLGPMNGQLWACIHAAGAALATGLLLGLAAGPLAHALALALAHPLRATVPGFMGPDSKLLVAAEPSAAGVRAARLAAAGVTGPLDALDDRRGALAALSFEPVRPALDRLGEGWATTTLCVKPYPGCAYLDTTLDALHHLLAGSRDGGEPLDPDDVASVEVAAGMLTCGMDALSRPYAAAEPPTPVTVTFSVGWNVAIALLAGRVTPDETSEPWLAAHAARLRDLAARVRVRHDPELTGRTAHAFGRLLPAAGIARAVGPGRLVGAIRRLRAEHPSTGLGLSDVAGLLRVLRSPSAVAGAARATQFWDPDALASFTAAFPARVTIRLRDGRERSAQADAPRGGAGNGEATPQAVARQKLLTWAGRWWSASHAATIDDAVEHDDAKLAALLQGRGGLGKAGG